MEQKEITLKEFWDRVRTCNPEHIKSDEIKLVSDEDIDFLIKKIDANARKDERERVLKALIEQAEPYDNAKWHNQLSIETVKKIVKGLSDNNK